MEPARSSSAAIVLAAGRATRFGGGKLLAQLEQRPILQHVLDLLAEAGLGPVVVVLGAGAAEIESAITWRGEVRVRNRDPDRGLSSSVRVGLTELELVAAEADRALIVLGDQPRLSAEQLAVLLAMPSDPARPVVVPRYDDGRPGNPVMLERAAWSLAADLSGDRGMSQLFEARPQLVRYVDLPGHNPDVDTPADLAALDH